MYTYVTPHQCVWPELIGPPARHLPRAATVRLRRLHVHWSNASRSLGRATCRRLSHIMDPPRSHGSVASGTKQATAVAYRMQYRSVGEAQLWSVRFAQDYREINMDCHFCTRRAKHAARTLWGIVPVCAKHCAHHGRPRSPALRLSRRRVQPKRHVRDLPGQLHFEFMRS